MYPHGEGRAKGSNLMVVGWSGWRSLNASVYYAVDYFLFHQTTAREGESWRRKRLSFGSRELVELKTSTTRW